MEHEVESASADLVTERRDEVDEVENEEVDNNADDNDDDDDDVGVDLERLKLLLSDGALAALNEHLNGKKDANTNSYTNSKSSNSSDGIINVASNSSSGDHININNNSSSNINIIEGISNSAKSDNKKFSKKDYWDERFDAESEYDWLAKYGDLKKYLVPHLKAADNILVVGCGNSRFSEMLYDDGYENITNIDFSEIVIQRMSEMHSAARPKMKWLVMDMTKLSFPEGFCFDVVIDKAAMDALMVDEGDVWYPSQRVVDSVDAMCKCTRQVLKEDGLFLQISFAQPHFRSKYLSGKHADGTLTSAEMTTTITGSSKRYRWHLLPVSIIKLEEGCLDFYLYIMHCTAE